MAHCGHTTEGFHLWTVTAVDVATGWVEMDVVWGKTQERVCAAIQRMRRRLPVPLLGLDSDNGSEFINKGLYTYCESNGITFTRSRPYRRTTAHTSSRRTEPWCGGSQVTLATRRRQPPASCGMSTPLARLQANFFQPVRKLIERRRQGARVVRYHDEGMTPYQRMIDSGLLVGARRATHERLYQSLNPLRLNRQIEAEIEQLLRLAWRRGDPLAWSPSR